MQHKLLTVDRKRVLTFFCSAASNYLTLRPNQVSLA